MSRSRHSTGGAAPYTVTQTVVPGSTISIPRGGSHGPAADSAAWQHYPIAPCRGLQVGHDEGLAHFSPVATSKSAAMFIYGCLTWVYYCAAAPFLISIEKWPRDGEDWLIAHFSDGADFTGFDQAFQRLLKADDLETAVYALCDEVR